MLNNLYVVIALFSTLVICVFISTHTPSENICVELVNTYKSENVSRNHYVSYLDDHGVSKISTVRKHVFHDIQARIELDVKYVLAAIGRGENGFRWIIGGC